MTKTTHDRPDPVLDRREFLIGSIAVLAAASVPLLPDDLVIVDGWILRRSDLVGKS